MKSIVNYPPILGFRLATDPSDEPVWEPRTPHSWGPPACVFPQRGDDGHNYDARCAYCQFGAFPEARDAVLAAMSRWGQRVVGVLGHEAVVRGWDRNGCYLFLEFPESSVPVTSPARDWSPA